MTITVVKDHTNRGFIWTLGGTCLFPVSCQDCMFDATALCNTRISIIEALNITSFPYILDTDDYPEYLI